MEQQKENRILLVDDEEAILLAFKRILDSPGTTIDTASSPDSAKKLLNQNRYLAVIADLRMSGAAIMDGYVVISNTKKSQPDAKIIVITAYGSDSTKKKVFGLGADMYLEKPVSPHKVKEILTSMGVYRSSVE